MGSQSDKSDILGKLPSRIALAGGWIDQPFVSKHNPDPPGSMVVVALEPTFRFMERCGMGTSTRKVARALWGERIPAHDPAELTRELYAQENQGRDDPSGAQDMIGIIYPGINRLDFDFNHEGGYFPVHIESNNDPVVGRWLEQILHMVPVAQRPPGYYPLGVKNLDPAWIRRLSQSGKACFDAIVTKNAQALGDSMNECMTCWEAILPHTVRHPTITIDLMAILAHYQSRYAGAMYSGCGGGYIYVVSEEPVPGSFGLKVRLAQETYA